MGNIPGAGSVSSPSGIIWYRVPSQAEACDTNTLKDIVCFEIYFIGTSFYGGSSRNSWECSKLLVEAR